MLLLFSSKKEKPGCFTSTFENFALSWPHHQPHQAATGEGSTQAAAQTNVRQHDSTTRRGRRMGGSTTLSCHPAAWPGSHEPLLPR